MSFKSASARAERVVAALGALCALAVLIAAFRIPVIQDEAYYWTWSTQLAPTYFDHPPGIAFVLRATAALFGDGLLGLRFAPLLSMLVTIVATWAASRRLAGHQLAKTSGRIAMVCLLGSPMFLVGFIPGTPDPIHGALTAVAAFLVVSALEPGRSSLHAFFAAVVLAFAVLFKHYAALIAAGAVIGLLLTARGRTMLRSKPAVLGALTGLLILVPWLVLEWRAEGGSIAFQASRVFRGSAFSRWGVALPMTLGSLLLTFGPMSALVLLYFCYRALRDRTIASGVVMASGAMALLAACFLAVGLGSGEANWPMPAMIFALPLVAVEVARRPSLSRWVVRVGSASALILCIYLAHVAAPFLPLPVRRDPAMRGAGFDRLATAVKEVSGRVGAKAVLAPRYQPASLLRYHLHDQLPVVEISSDRGRRSQYDVWARLPLCKGDVVVTALPGEGMIELGRPKMIADQPERQIDRNGERWWVRAVVIQESVFDSADSCKSAAPTHAEARR